MIKKYLKPGLKIIGTVVCLGFVASNIRWRESLDILREADIWWILAALVVLNLSQIVSARRLQFFFDLLQMPMSTLQNIFLYYRGMFYNLLLPGGIGGDGYKVYFLKRRYGKRTGILIKALVADRLTGLVAIIGIVLILANWIDVPVEWQLLSNGGLLLIYPAFYLFLRIFAKRLLPVFGRVNVMAVIVQALQVLSVTCLLAAMGFPEGLPVYLLLFLISSLAFAIPVSIGGLGLREVVFLYGSRYFMFDEELSVAISLMFFLLNALSSVPGAFVEMRAGEKAPSPQRSA